MKKTFFFIFLSALMLITFSCSKVAQDEQPTPQKTQRNAKSGNGFTFIDVPSDLISKTGIVDTIFIKDFTIGSPKTANYSGKVRIKGDADGDIVSIEVDNDFLNETNIGTDFLVGESSCSDRVKAAYGKCRAKCNTFLSHDTRQDCKLDCATTAFFAGVYDATIGWVAGCYYQ